VLLSKDVIIAVCLSWKAILNLSNNRKQELQAGRRIGCFLYYGKMVPYRQ
jgi:hypothetical protein